jgi:hypothetical protein
MELTLHIYKLGFKKLCTLSCAWQQRFCMEATYYNIYR